jgi:hypothetical protein
VWIVYSVSSKCVVFSVLMSTVNVARVISNDHENLHLAVLGTTMKNSRSDAIQWVNYRVVCCCHLHHQLVPLYYRHQINTKAIFRLPWTFTVCQFIHHPATDLESQNSTVTTQLTAHSASATEGTGNQDMPMFSSNLQHSRTVVPTPLLCSVPQFSITVFVFRGEKF